MIKKMKIMMSVLSKIPDRENKNTLQNIMYKQLTFCITPSIFACFVV